MTPSSFLLCVERSQLEQACVPGHVRVSESFALAMRPDDPHWQLQLTTEVPTVNRLGRRRVLSNLSLGVLRASRRTSLVGASTGEAWKPDGDNAASRLRSVAASEVASNAAFDIITAPDVNLSGAL